MFSRLLFRWVVRAFGLALAAAFSSLPDDPSSSDGSDDSSFSLLFLKLLLTCGSDSVGSPSSAECLSLLLSESASSGGCSCNLDVAGGWLVRDMEVSTYGTSNKEGQ